MSMLRTIKPKNARVKRALEEREPKLVENEKTAIFVRGQNTSEKVRAAMSDLMRAPVFVSIHYSLKRPSAISFSRKNDIHPFEDASSLEFFAGKNNASLFLTGLHSKKRPNDLVFTRMFDGRVLDMVELGIEEIRGMSEFESVKASVGVRPLMVFHSDLFDTQPSFISLKSMLLDFYNGHSLPTIPLGTIEHVISITAGPLPPSSAPTTSSDSPTQPLPRIHFRVYTITLLPTPGGAPPKLNLTEMGPSIDFSLRRLQPADEELLKQAMKRPKVDKKTVESGLGKKRKNIETDEMGDRVGKLHFKKQDLKGMQGRKMKGLKEGMEKRGKRAKVVLPGETTGVNVEE